MRRDEITTSFVIFYDGIMHSRDALACLIRTTSVSSVFKRVIRPAVLYETETMATMMQQVTRIWITDMRMLRWVCGLIWKVEITNDEHIRGTPTVA